VKNSKVFFQKFESLKFESLQQFEKKGCRTARERKVSIHLWNGRSRNSTELESLSSSNSYSFSEDEGEALF